MSDTMNIEDLKRDRLNFNKGTYEGEVLVRKSLERLKAGRSILIDKDNNIIAGNKTAEAASQLGLKVKVIETDGTELIAVKRTDLDIGPEDVSVKFYLSWDEENLDAAAMEYSIDPAMWGVDLEHNAPTAESKGEIDVGTFSTDQTLCIKLTTMQYESVVNRLKQESTDLSEALLQILGYYA